MGSRYQIGWQMTVSLHNSDYRVVLPIYRGPLDLLLFLVKKHEVDILDIPIAIITRSFLQYLEVIQSINLEDVGDFLVMASTLMEIKSRLLLPGSNEYYEDEAESAGKTDPRAELVKQLVAYRRFREASEQLERLEAHQASYWPRGSYEKPHQELEPSQQPVQQVELWDLVSAFDRLLRATLSHQQNAIAVDETPLHVRMDEMLDHLRSTNEAIEFENLFTYPHTRPRLISLFLALLELIKMRRVAVEQVEPFGSIMVRLIEESVLAA